MMLNVCGLFCHVWTVVSNVLIGNQVRESLRKWATSPDPSTNHNIACGIQLGGTAQWFFQGSMFSEWRSNGSLLWIYGKRMYSPIVSIPRLVTLRALSWIREKHLLVSISTELYASTNSCSSIAPQSFKTSCLSAKLA